MSPSRCLPGMGAAAPTHPRGAGCGDDEEARVSQSGHDCPLKTPHEAADPVPLSRRNTLGRVGLGFPFTFPFAIVGP